MKKVLLALVATILLGITAGSPIATISDVDVNVKATNATAAVREYKTESIRIEKINTNKTKTKTAASGEDTESKATEAIEKKEKEKKEIEENRKEKEKAKKKKTRKRAKKAVAKVINEENELTETASWELYDKAVKAVDKLPKSKLKKSLKKKLKKARKLLLQLDVLDDFEDDTMVETEQILIVQPETPETEDIIIDQSPVDIDLSVLDAARVSMVPIENHDRVNDLTPEEQAVYNQYKSSFLDAMFLSDKYVIYNSSNFSDAQYNMLSEVIRDELFPYQFPDNYFYYTDENDDGIVDLVCNPSELWDCYTVNQNYKSIVQTWAKELVSPDMDEKTAYYAIADWLIGHLSYAYGAYEAKCGVNGCYGTCMVYSFILKDMCNAVGINCSIDAGYANDELGTGLHQWNIVIINGVQYYADLCWADTDDATYDKYTLSAGLWSNHTSDRQYR